MGLLFTSSKKENTNVIIFDIGSGNVGGAIVQIPVNKGELPVIVKSARVDIASFDNNDFNLLLKNTIKAIDSTARDLNKNNIHIIEEVVCVLASPWYLSETRVIKMEREHTFNFTKRIADELLKKEINSLTEIYQKKYGSSDKPEVIDSLVMGVSLNGYPVDEPLGKICKSVDLNILVSLSSRFFLDKIRESILKTFHHIPIDFSSFVASSYIAVRDRYISPNSYILVDVSGEITDVSIITEGILRYSASFPQGRKTFLKYISKIKNIELRDAQELFNLFNAGNLSESLKIKSESIFKSIEDMWSNGFRQSFNNMPNTLMLPEVVFLTADDDIKKWFVNIIESEEYSSSRLGRKFDVVTLEGHKFLDMCNVKNSTCDPFLMIEAISVMRRKEK